MRRTQRDRSASTKSALTAAARELFATRGYADVPADEIVRAAGVTRGALYHHYGDKQGLFRAVLEELEQEVTAEIVEVFERETDTLTTLAVALDVFLTACMRDDVRQISLTDAPTVIGWAAWRELEAEYGLGVLIKRLEKAVEDGALLPLPVPTAAQLILSTVLEAARMIAEAEDRAAKRAEVQEVLGVWFAALIKPE